MYFLWLLIAVLQRILSFFIKFSYQSLNIDFIRLIVTYCRFFYSVKILKRLRTYDIVSKNIGVNTISHNLVGLKDLTVSRSLLLIRPLSSIESVSTYSHILVVGPRTEGELFNLLANGFSRRNIRGLDLISYSKWIDLGDMHEMPYKDNSWDAIIMGWVLAYSFNREKAASEVIRVSKNGGVVAIGIEYYPKNNDEVISECGYLPGNPERITSVTSILSFFGDNVDKIYFYHDILPERKNVLGSIIVIFSIKK